MRYFLLRVCLFLFLLLAVVETISRLFIDPGYFSALDTYTVKFPNTAKPKNIEQKETTHIDFLFLGSSRVPATINPEKIMQESPDKIAVVAGRGYTTPGLIHQALSYKLKKYPGFLSGSMVFLEYPDIYEYANPFEQDKFKVWERHQPGDKPMGHLILPYLDFPDLLSFMKESGNTLPVKMNVAMMFFISSYRTGFYVREKLQRSKFNTIIKLPVVDKNFAETGGIRNDNIKNAKTMMRRTTNARKREILARPAFSFEMLSISSLSEIHQLITENGGALYLYKMPISTHQQAIFNNQKSIESRKTFELWLTERNIKIISNDSFHYDDSDFPDRWHLKENRRDEFTHLLYQSINQLNK